MTCTFCCQVPFPAGSVLSSLGAVCLELEPEFKSCLSDSRVEALKITAPMVQANWCGKQRGDSHWLRRWWAQRPRSLLSFSEVANETAVEPWDFKEHSWKPPGGHR